MRVCDDVIRESRIGGEGPLLLTQAMPGAQTVALGVFLDVGSRDEPEDRAGIAHALEHMVFKGAGDLDVDALGSALDELGGTANAFTTRERTCYHMRVLPEDWPRALGMLCDMALAPWLPGQEWQREREVIRAEMAMVEDAPEDWVFDRHLEALFPGQSAGRPVLGRRETLTRMTCEDLAAFRAEHYRPPRLLIAAAGAVEHREVASFLAGRDWPAAAHGGGRGRARMAEGVQHLTRDDEQAHLVCSFPGIAAASDERPVAWIANQMLGGGMSSRLFREVREKRGLAYGVASHLSSLSDVGAWTVSAGVAPGRLGECVRVVRDVLERFAASAGPDEFARARRQLEVSMRMGMESTEAAMLQLGARFDEAQVRPQAWWVERLKRVTLEQVRAWAASRLSSPALWTFSGPEAAMAMLPEDLQG